MDDTYGPKPLQLKAYVGAPPDNASYLTCMKNCPSVTTPMDSGTFGMLLLLSTLQYQAPYMGPTYSNAASQAGKAAYVQVGGQAMQDKMTSQAENQAKQAVKSLGITDAEMGVVLGTAKVVRDRQIDVNGPKIYFVKTHVTVGQDHGSLGLGINF